MASPTEKFGKPSSDRALTEFPQQNTLQVLPPCQNLSILAGTLLLRKNSGRLQVLLVHQRNKSNYRWSLPKGKVEVGEDFEAAARRETFEETGIKPGELSFLGTVLYGTKKPKCFCCFAGIVDVVAAGEFLSREIDNVAFVEIEFGCSLVNPSQAKLIRAFLK